MCPSVATCLSGSVVSVVDMFSLGIYLQGDFAIPSVRFGGGRGAIQGDFAIPAVRLGWCPFREILLFFQ